MKSLFAFLFLAWAGLALGQTASEESRFISKLKHVDSPPDGLLSSRTGALFSPGYSQKELEEIQTGFQQIGIDVVSYVESERALAGHDLMNAYSLYFAKREVKFLLFMEKDQGEYQMSFVSYNGKPEWIDVDQPSWFITSSTLRGLLEKIFRALISSQKRQNFLVNDYPERSGPVTTIAGSRDENWAPLIRYHKLAIPRTGEPETDKEVERYLREIFRGGKLEFVEADANEKDLVEKEFKYVLRFIHTRGALAKEILGYDMSKSETALATEAYPNGTLQLKTIPSATPIFKFYIKNIDDDIFYLGPRWDADVTLLNALKNHFEGYKSAGKLN